MNEPRSVAQLIEAGGLPIGDVVRLIHGIASAVAAAHEAGAAYGDIRASNVFVLADGTLKLPELGSRPGEPLEDLRSLGALLVELLKTSVKPPVCSARAETTAPVRVDLGTAPLVDLMLRSLARAPERLPSASAFVSELSQAMGRLHPRGTELMPPSPAAPFSWTAPDLVGRVVAGRYRVDSVIGRGSSSIIYEARHLELGSRAAIKVLAPAEPGLADEAMHDRFEFEARVLASLFHPNVVAVHDLGATDDGFRYIVMERLQGETLGALLAREHRLPPAAAVAIATQVAEALAALHRRGLIHRDVKPSNLFVTRDAFGEQLIKLMDFGLVRALEESAGGDELRPRRRMQTLSGVVLGTGAYMSPELIQGKPLDARSDVYALGVVCYRLLTGSLPFDDDDMPRLLARHLGEAVEPPARRAPDAGISSALERVVLGALAKDRDDRPPSARAFAAALRAALNAEIEPSAHVTAPAVACSIAPRAPEGASSRRRRLLGGVAAVLGVPGWCSR